MLFKLRDGHLQNAQTTLEFDSSLTISIRNTGYREVSSYLTMSFKGAAMGARREHQGDHRTPTLLVRE